MEVFSEDKYVLGVDIGGSHITTALVEIGSLSILKESVHRAKVNCHGTKDEIVDSWCEAMQSSWAFSKIAPTKIGIAIPGPFDYENGICLMKGNDKYKALYGLNIKELLSGKLGTNTANMRMENDAGCFLKGEVFAGVAKGFSKAIAVILGTGLGSSRYSNGIAEDADLWQVPFKEGIAEDYLSTRWFVQRYHALSGYRAKDAKEISALYNIQENARQVFQEFGVNLGEFLVQFVNMDHPDIIVLGGNICNSLPLFLPQVKETLQVAGITTAIVKASLGEDAPIIGACSSIYKKNEACAFSNTIDI